MDTSLYFTMWGYLDIPQVMLIHSHSTYALFIGVETGGARGARAPPIHVFYPHDFINIHACSADCRDRSVYYVWPPKMELLPTPMLLPNASIRAICSICSNEANSGLSHSCQVNECAATHGFPWNVVVVFVLGSTRPG